MSLDDNVLARLVRVVDEPDLTGTHYELRGEIGRGGMGTVYRAFDARLQREVALKVTEAGDATEARIAASLEHPGIVPVYDAGVLADGRVFHAMRMVRGEPLHVHVKPETPMSERIAIFLKICEAVSFAHSCGVIHRDLKPANIMVGTFGEVTVLDWGLAGRGESDAAIAGTPEYMAPEQAKGAAPNPLADVYSLGTILTYLLLPGAPRPLKGIAEMARHVDRGKRYPSVQALSSDIHRFQDGFAVEAYRENPMERVIRFAGRNRILLLLFAAYFVARIAVYVFSGR